MTPNEPGPLLVLTADPQMQTVIETLLRERQPALGIEVAAYEVRRHPRSDPGCRTDAVERVRPALRDFGRLLVVFDYDGCGSNDPPEEIEQRVEAELAANGWSGRSKVIVIVPELEAWVWGRSDGALQALGWDTGFLALRAWLARQERWPKAEPKPPVPKEAAAFVLRRSGRVLSARFFARLAAAADFSNCRDRAFLDLRKTLRAWYPPAPPAQRDSRRDGRPAKIPR